MSTITTMTLDELQALPPLSERDKEIIRNAKPTPTDDCPAMTKEELKEFKPYYATEKKAVTINLDNGVLAYFENMSKATGIGYKNLINLYLLQCAKEKKKILFA